MWETRSIILTDDQLCMYDHDFIKTTWQKLLCVCEDKFEFENPRHNPLVLATPHLALKDQNFLLTKTKFAFNRVLLPIQQYQSEQAHLFRS